MTEAGGEINIGAELDKVPYKILMGQLDQLEAAFPELKGNCRPKTEGGDDVFMTHHHLQEAILRRIRAADSFSGIQ